MTDSQKAAQEIFELLETAQEKVLEGGWKLRANLVPIVAADGQLVLDKGAVLERIRQIIDRHLC